MYAARPHTTIVAPRRRIAGGAALVLAAATLAGLSVVSAPEASAAAFGSGNIVVARVGTGAAALASTATPVFLDEYTTSGVLVQTVTLPTAAAGANRALTLSGTATTEGALQLSADGAYLSLIGYDTAPGTASVTSSSAATINRVVARVAADGSVDTSTALGDAHTGASPRGAVSADGTSFWTTGGSGGVRVAGFGATTSTQLNAAPTNVRVPGIADGQLFASSQSGSNVGVNRIGTGLPTTTGQAATLLPGLASGLPADPNGFVFLDRGAAVPGVDTLYVADNSASPAGGVAKFSFDGTTWTARGNLRVNGAGARGIAGTVAGTQADLVVTTNVGGGALVRVADAAAFDAPIAAITSTVTQLAAAATNVAFRGVAFAPVGAPVTAAPTITAQPQSVTIVTGATTTLSVTATGTAPLTYQWYQGPTGTTTTPVGTDSPTFTTPALTTTTPYWVRVTNSVGSVDSAAATVTVAPPAVCTATPTPIGQVQGPGASTPVAGTTVTVRGTVVGDYEGPAPELRGFYVQDAGDGTPTTSDGIFVFNNIGGTSPNTVTLGQTVQVTGTAGENFDQTQLNASTITVCAGTTAVTPTDVTLPLASPTALEPVEGMLVRLAQTATVTEFFQLGRFGQVVVSSGDRLRQPTSLFLPDDPQRAALQTANSLNRLIIDDGDNAQNADPIVFGRGGAPLSAANTLRGGDTVTNPVGVMTFTWAGNAASGDAFRLRPVDALNGTVTFTAVDARPTTPPPVGGTVRVVGANVLNFFNTFGTTACSFGVGGAGAECRGASNAAEFQRQIDKTVPGLSALDADVIGVVEIENDGYGPTSALATLVDELNAVDGAGTWAYIDVDAATGVLNSAGTDAIKVGVLYRPAVVTPVPGTTRAATGAAATFERIPVSQAFTTADGAVVSVVVNHFKSKSTSGCPTAAGDPDADAGDGQGCFNGRRTAQAEALATFISGAVVPAASGDPDVLIVGDLNSYTREDPIEVLVAAGYVDLLAQFGGPSAYSYVFDGQWAYLDYAMASTSLVPQVTGAVAHHVNADEPSVLDYLTDFKTVAQQTALYAPDQYRSSDHDPVLVGLTLTPPGGTGPVSVLASDPTFAPLLAALSAQIPDLVVVPRDAVAGTFAVSGCPTTTSPLPLDRPDYLDLLGGGAYDAFGATTAGPLAPACIPGAVTVYGQP